MPDIGDWPHAYQWGVGIGVFLAGILAALFGAKNARNLPEYDERDAEIEKLRDAARDAATRTQFALEIASAKQAMADALSATRQSFYGEFKVLDQRIRDVESSQAALKSEVERRRPPRS